MLGKLFSNTKISFQILGNQIVLKKLDDTKIESIATADQRQVEGIVTDKAGMPLIGVSVMIEGTKTGAVTDYEGRFKLNGDATGKFISFSNMGYKSKRIAYGGQSLMKVVLEEELNELEEVVLVGYGKQKRSEFSGAVSSVSAKDIVQASTGTIGFDRALGGLVKGIQVSQNTGRPGAPVRINIRGLTSPLSSVGGGLNQPLFVIDGVPFNFDALNGANPLSTLNPNDIQSFDILKDAGATSIYGSRGANGVIIIKTKRGKKGQPARVNFNYATTIAKPISTVGALNASQYKNFYNQLINNSVDAMNNGQLDPFTAFDLQNIAKVDLDFDTFIVSNDGINDDYFGTANTDWNKEVFRTMAITKQANISLSGGSQKTNYNFSTSFIDQEGLTIKDKMKQYNLGLSLDTDLTKYVKIGTSVNVGHTEANSGENDILNQFTINTSIAGARPDLAPRDANGKLVGQAEYQYGFMTLEPNPLMRLGNKTNNKAYNFIGGAYIEIEPLKDLKLKAESNASIFYNKNSSFIPKTVETDFVFFPNDSYLAEADGLVSNITTNLTADYNFNISLNHKFGILGGAAWDRTNFNSSSHFYSGFPDDEILNNATSARTIIGYSTNKLDTGLYS
ncbi:TonB-linked outer membrane protein, SusC/RagA family [Flavobacterium segetis]|uniref:TonB-linked outer membrane protein, SusC/RagA family n=1 Tax=Flavobacterium segetis TaxID=271157 RepID=A0A1M5EM76_9FLAO|nr:SusC/RagA family TonB-linked outer membrane protein [Flavobacterium segetis]SHF80132.1 TonB-linked outer membrane protein, SusC/RagA family [Flavobacterium segetis]